MGSQEKAVVGLPLEDFQYVKPLLCMHVGILKAPTRGKAMKRQIEESL